jgi:hypothetical protein
MRFQAEGEAMSTIENEHSARLKNFIREHSSGGCKMFSKGSDCLCPLCDVDALRGIADEWKLQQKQAQAALTAAEATIAELRAELGLCCLYACEQPGKVGMSTTAHIDPLKSADYVDEQVTDLRSKLAAAQAQCAELERLYREAMHDLRINVNKSAMHEPIGVLAWQNKIEQAINAAKRATS